MGAKLAAPMGSIKETAAYWAMRLSSPDCGPADRAAHAAWLEENPAHQEAFERTQRALQAVDRHANTPEIEAMARTVLQETEHANANQWRWAAGIAAALMLTAGVAFSIQIFGAADDAVIADAGEFYETAVGERSTVVLTDGSTVTLNTNSQIDVTFAPGRRDIKLVRGQALFEVAKDAARPFVVEAGNQRITALGTAFDVRFDKQDEVKVVLVEGRVAVDELVPAAPGAAAAAAPDKRVEMIAGQRLVAAANITRAPEAADIEEETSWRDGRLLFRSEPISEVVAEVNRYSTEQIRVSDDPRFGELIVNGVFDAGKSQSIILALETMHPIDAQRTGSDEITLVWRE